MYNVSVLGEYFKSRTLLFENRLGVSNRAVNGNHVQTAIWYALNKNPILPNQVVIL